MADAWSLPLLGNQHFQYREFTEVDMECIAENLRGSDRDEIQATVGHCRYADALRLSVSASASAVIAVTAYGEPVAILGVTTMSLLGNVGSPWFMATPRANAKVHRRAFLEVAGDYVDAMLERYAYLVNHVDARNHVSVRWLRCLGFLIEPACPHGALNLPFHRFSISRQPCAFPL